MLEDQVLEVPVEEARDDGEWLVRGNGENVGPLDELVTGRNCINIPLGHSPFEDRQKQAPIEDLLYLEVVV